MSLIQVRNHTKKRLGFSLKRGEVLSLDPKSATTTEKSFVDRLRKREKIKSLDKSGRPIKGLDGKPQLVESESAFSIMLENGDLSLMSKDEKIEPEEIQQVEVKPNNKNKNNGRR